MVEELKESRLQRADEMQEQCIHQQEESLPPIHFATKLLIKKYGEMKQKHICFQAWKENGKNNS